MDINNCIRFDWAAKFILRYKADFKILESFVSTVLNEKVTITELLESESNRRAEDALPEVGLHRSEHHHKRSP